MPALLAIGALLYVLRDLPSAADLSRAPLAQSTNIYDRDGKELLYRFEEERRDAVRYHEVPRLLVDATVAAEDKSFFTNPGVDVLGIARAIFSEVTNRGTGQGGASTITQQLVKLRLIGAEHTITRKIREAALAIDVTRTYSKESILELYLNQIYYGNGAYGVKAAAATYFGKNDLHTLTLPEVALLAGLPQAPSVLDPSREENQDRATARRAYVLDQLVSVGRITQREADAADATPITTIGARVATISAPLFVFQVRNQLAEILGGEGAVTRGGFKVTTSLDWWIQQVAERQMKDNIARLRGGNVHNGALVSLDTRSGEVLAYVGSVDYQSRTDPRAQGQYDVAGIGVRQPGSSFKIFNYLTALKKGATAATVVVDARTDFGGGYRPENADLQYHGPITMRQAIRESRNVPAVKFLQQYSGIDDTIATARELGITTAMDRGKVGLALTLGAVEVKLLDMTSAYGAIANLGVRTAPTFILKVEDPKGNVIWEHKDYEQKRVLDPGLAYVMVDMLRDTTQPDRSFVFGSFTNIGRPAGLKTGTTDNLKDVYAVGFTPTLVTGVWMGNSNGDFMSGISSALGPGILWREYMREIYMGFPASDWQRPTNIVEASVVVAPGAYGGYGSGLAPSSVSPFASREVFVRGTEPRKIDDWYALGCGGSSGALPVPGDGTAVTLELKEGGPAQWKADRDRWTRDAMAGLHSYDRYRWNLRLEGSCLASPSPPASPSGSPRPPSSPSGSPRPPATATPSPAETLRLRTVVPSGAP
ncbi:MAG: penicillin-binding protein [Chloroflexi bacterium]|nr:penicillin-binding protein [Chloroflexota bacterium]